MTTEETNIAAVRAFFAGQSGSPSEVAPFYYDDVVQEECPNAYLPRGARRNLQELKEAGERGRKVRASQTYEIVNIVAHGNTVVVESNWTGTLAVPIGDETPAGSVLRARFAQFFEFDDGEIVRQRNYDCFYPW